MKCGDAPFLIIALCSRFRSVDAAPSSLCCCSVKTAPSLSHGNKSGKLCVWAFPFSLSISCTRLWCSPFHLRDAVAMKRTKKCRWNSPAHPHFTPGGFWYFSRLRAAVVPCSESQCVKSESRCAIWLTGTWPLMMTSSAKRTLTGLVFNLAFLAALMNADLGDFGKERKKKHKAEN